jgi:hypothetical protein
MPEAAVHEDADFLAWKGKVGSPWQPNMTTPSGDTCDAKSGGKA